MTYQELIDAAQLYADRFDVEVENSLDIFIVMTEARMNRVLKTREQTTRSALFLFPDEEYYPLPVDYAGMRDIQWNSTAPLDPANHTHPFEYLAPVLFNERRNQPFGGKYYYTIIADQIQVFPIPGETGHSLEIVYYQKVPNLNKVAIRNWMSRSHPDIYLAGIVSEIEIFAKNYEVGKGWNDRMTVAIGELKTSDIEERWSGAPLIIKTENNTLNREPVSVPGVIL